MPLPNEAKYFADLNAATTEADTHLLALQQGSPPVGGATPTPTRKWSLLALRTWLQNHFVRGPAAAVTADRLALFDGTTGRLLKQAGSLIGSGLSDIATNAQLGSGAIVQSAAFDSYGNYALAKQAAPGPGYATTSNNYVLLIPWGGTGSGYVHARFFGRRNFANDSGARAMEFDIHAIRDGAGKIARLSNGQITYVIGTYRPSLVTVDYAGVNWLALKLIQDASFRPLAIHAFVGKFDGQSNQLLSVGAAQISNEVAWATSEANVIGSGGWFGFPGAAIGYNQSLHIAGNPNTSRAVFVDSNGFIKVV